MAEKRGEELRLLDGNPSVVGSERIPAFILFFFPKQATEE